MDKILEPTKVKTGAVVFDCPDCGKEVNFQEAFTEEKLGNGVERVSLICPYCQGVNVGYYSNEKIRNNITRLKRIREKHDSSSLEEYKSLQAKHIKYFDKFQLLMRERAEIE